MTAMKTGIAKPFHLSVGIATFLLASCSSVSIPEPGDGEMSGRVFVEWDREDKFIYRKTDRPVSFKPSFMSEPIVPEDMYTDGGSVPRVFWNVPGLSPWALGPAYIMHDWIFEVHRCGRDAPEAVKAITFEQSAQILAEVGKYLVDARLIDHDRLPEIVAAIRSRFARNVWDRPGTEEECQPPPTAGLEEGARVFAPVVDFEIPKAVR
ncbi:MAG: hypothetical protein WAU86_15175 [Oricola sp.]